MMKNSLFICMGGHHPAQLKHGSAQLELGYTKSDSHPMMTVK